MSVRHQIWGGQQSAQSGGSPVYYDIGNAADNEILLLLEDRISNLISFTVTVANSTNYVVEIYGAGGVLLDTLVVSSGATFSYSLPGGGVDSGHKFLSYKCRIYSQTGANAITTFSSFTTTTNSSILKVKFGTTGLTSLANGLKDTKYLQEVVFPATLDSITTFADCFNGSVVPSVVFPVSLPACTSFSQVFLGSFTRETTLPTTMAAVTTFFRAFYGSLIEELVMPATLNTVTTMSEMVYNCKKLISLTLPTSATGLTGTAFDSIIAGCYSLETLTEITTINTNQISATTNSWLNALASFDQSALRASKLLLNGQSAANPGALTSIEIDWANSTYGGAAPQIDIRYNALPKTELERIFGLLPANTAKTINIATNVGNDTKVSKANAGTTDGSITVTLADTSALAAGMEVYGTGIDSAIACTFQDAGDTVTKVAHGLTNGMIVSFATIVTTTGITIYTRYYVVNKTDDTFQLSLTQGGAALELTTNGSGTYLSQPTIVSIDPNVSITLDRPCSATATVTMTAGILNESIATQKHWTVTRT